MLNDPHKEPRARARRKARRKWHDGQSNVPSMGCSICPEYGICGGLRVSRPLFWCLDYCCGNQEKCDVVCRNNARFVDHVREIGGFNLHSVARAPTLPKPTIGTALPLLFHGNSRHGSLKTAIAALPFARMFDRRSGAPRFSSRDELCSKFRIDPQTTILLSGTDDDAPIENWWQLGRASRLNVIRMLTKLGVALATTPNYSLFIDQPRWDDLHSMKRISIVHGEMLGEGFQAALHVNSRTEADFLRWTDYIRDRSEIEIIAYEFSTGTGWIGRREIHADWLTRLARDVGRPLHLIMRGGIELLPALESVFDQVTFIDTAAFMKTMKRQRAFVSEAGRLLWRAAPSELGAPLDELLNDNVVTVTTWICSQFQEVRVERLTA